MVSSFYNLRTLVERLDQNGFQNCSEELSNLIKQKLTKNKSGDLERWLNSFHEIIKFPKSDVINLTNSVFASSGDVSENQKEELKRLLMELSPWRTGPYSINEVVIDSEWQSNFKWNRLQSSIDLYDKTVLDIGCNSGYFSWRIAGKGARFVLGVDPSQLCLMQFLSVKHFLDLESVFLAPLRLEELPSSLTGFDVIFSMGVFYHRKSPVDHLYKIKKLLSSNGQLVLETLIVDSSYSDSLIPVSRYAKMNNVWFLPTVELLKSMITRVGFSEIDVINISETTVEEQRSTEWMKYESLKDFLDPEDSSLTIEGYPRPLRVVIKASI